MHNLIFEFSYTRGNSDNFHVCSVFKPTLSGLKIEKKAQKRTEKENAKTEVKVKFHAMEISSLKASYQKVYIFKENKRLGSTITRRRRKNENKS